MGPLLNGGTRPFSPTGKSSYARATVSYEAGATELTQAGFNGILFHWRTDPANVKALLPEPLEPARAGDEAYLLLGVMQEAPNAEFIRDEPPEVVIWNEARLLIPCTLGDTRGSFSWVAYTNADNDSRIELAHFEGLVTKGASFYKTFPFPAQPWNREMQPGVLAQMLLSRFDQRIVTGTLRAERELAADEIDDAIDSEELLSFFGIRYMPDWARPSEPPLVHDLVLWRNANRMIPRAWLGKCELTFGDSRDEELDLLQPKEMLPGYFVHLAYQRGPGTCSAVHHYAGRSSVAATV
jgi:hypothetical protein